MAFLNFSPQWSFLLIHNEILITFLLLFFFVASRFLILICPFLQPGEDDLRYASCSKVDMHTKSQCKPCIVSEHEMDMQWSEVFQREWVHMSHRSSFMKMLEVWVWGVRRGPLWVQMLLPLHTLGYVCHVGLYAKYAWILSWVAMQKKTPCSLQITFLQFRLSPKKKLIISPFCYPAWLNSLIHNCIYMQGGSWQQTSYYGSNAQLPICWFFFSDEMYEASMCICKACTGFGLIHDFFVREMHIWSMIWTCSRLKYQNSADQEEGVKGQGKMQWIQYVNPLGWRIRLTCQGCKCKGDCPSMLTEGGFTMIIMLLERRMRC